MKNSKHSDIKRFLHDKDLIELLCFDQSYGELLDSFCRDDFLRIKSNMSIPFFAEIRDYKGAVEVDSPETTWLVKEIKGKDILETGMAMIVYFVDFLTNTISVPLIITKIDNVLYKATKNIMRAEQLSGANYNVYQELYEQLLQDLINRWIFFDEDRNPNNYLLKYNSKNQSLILAIDFGNSDLMTEEMKIKGLAKKFGWQISGKNQYLTPLKTDHFFNYDMQFFNKRFEQFHKLNSKILLELTEKVLRFETESQKIGKIITRNILRRLKYVNGYFSSKLPEKNEESSSNDIMGKSFQQIYSKRS